MKTLLITGGAGFIGSNFVRHWLECYPDDRVINLDALTYAGNLENLEQIQDRSNYQFIQGDIANLVVRGTMQFEGTAIVDAPIKLKVAQ